jgi:putative SOS response-associated peptidase YedK
MCGRYARFGPTKLSRAQRAALESMGVDLVSSLDQRDDQFNIAPTQTAPVLAKGAEAFEVKGLRWGLVPIWAKDLAIGNHAINARVETVAEKPMFRSAFKKHRCLVPASGYFEWKKVDEKNKQPYFIHAPEGEVLMFAGLWEAWKPKDDEAAEWVRTFTLITGEPGKVSGDIHDRQPVILQPDTWADWLTEGTDVATDILAKAPEAELVYYPVPKAVGSPRNKGPELVEPIQL